MGNWWKIGSIVIIAGTLIAGLLIPLKPGVLRVAPDIAEGGQQIQIKAQGYNTHFAEVAGQNAAWLKLSEEHLLAAKRVTAINDRELELAFSIPASMPYKPAEYSLSLIIDNPKDGAFVLPGALFIQPKSISIDPASAEMWNAALPTLHSLQGISYPFRSILYETIRNQFFHVPLWFAMIILMAVSMVMSVRYLRSYRPEMDKSALAFARVGMLYGLLGLLTGAVWANYTWGAPWSNDIKQLVTAIALLIYLAYFILRMAIESPEQRARVGAVYNIFAFATLIPLLFIIPRLNNLGSLHPGNAGNPGFGREDLDNSMRMVFYPAIIGWTLLGIWLSLLWYRFDKVKDWVLEEAFTRSKKKHENKQKSN